MMRRTPLLLLTLLAATSLIPLLPGCDTYEFDPVDDVLIIGTRVPLDFLSTGMFEITATPLDMSGAAVLTDEIETEVRFSIAPGIQIGSTIVEVDTNEDGDPLAIAVVLDASGSMLDTDPQRLRITGAQEFIRVLDREATDWEAAAFDFPGGTPPFSDTNLLQAYTNDNLTLIDAIGQSSAGGSTPTYNALYEILNYSEANRSTATFERGAVLLSDGAPNDNSITRDQVCSLANALESPIYSIGLGPASDLSPFPSQSAVDEMRYLSDCTGGAYAGIAPDDLTAVSEIYTNIATATALGSVLIQVLVPSDVLALFAPGTIVTGTLQLEYAGGDAAAVFSFRTPSTNLTDTYLESGSE